MPEYYELLCFETDYSSFLKDRLLGGTKKYGSYIDPDCVKDVSKTDFYNDLADFLNGREKELEKELKNSYFFLPPAYAPQTPKWLQKHEDKKNSVDKKIITVEEKNDTGRLFFLKSDQFGFSAAETIYEKNKSDKHPLSRLLYQYKRQEKEEQDKIISRITEYIKNTRTIGGSKGDRLVSFDIDKIREKGYDPTVMVLVSNTDQFAGVDGVPGERVSSGKNVILIKK